MAKNTQYQLHLKGFVGGYDFDADYVDYILSKNAGKEVHVLIDSLGGKSNTALSIFSAFRRHGNVTAHFVGMNASAATIASLGAKRITMDSSAMYLVHKCSIAFFEWGHLNADDLQTLIDSIEHQKKDLDKLDANIAQMYATRCKKSPADLLALMKEGGWLTAKEALAWGFVDELTDYEEEAPVLDDTTIQALAQAGIPIPTLPKSSAEESALTRFFNTISSIFKNQRTYSSPSSQIMKKVYKNICAFLNVDALDSDGGVSTLTDEQLSSLENSIEGDKTTISSLQTQVDKLTNEKANLETEVASLKNRPADSSSHVVDDKHAAKQPTDFELFVNTRSEAQSLYEMIP